MTEEQIIKALECCSKDDCDNCPNAFGNCYANLARRALELIKSKDETIDWFATAKQTKERRVLDVFMNRTRVDTIKEFAKKLKERYSQYSHLHKQADEAINDVRYPDFEMRSVWNVMDLCQDEMATYETMGDLQENIEVIAKASLLAEFEKDLDNLVKEMVGADDET